MPPPPGEADATADSIDSSSDSSNGECGTGMTVLSCTTSFPATKSAARDRRPAIVRVGDTTRWNAAPMRPPIRRASLGHSSIAWYPVSVMNALGLSIVAISAGSLLLGCVTSTSKGGLDEPCDEQGGSLLGGATYSCNAGLVCNFAVGLPTPTCQNPNANDAGAPCSSDQNCAAGLFCSPMVGGMVCSPYELQGAPCPSGAGCAMGLTCVKFLDAGTTACEPEGGTAIVTEGEAGSDAESAE
jgi:Dickkopf-like protein